MAFSKLLIATTNPKKLREFKELFVGFPFHIVCLSDFSKIEEVEETGRTFEDNAVLKAVGYAKQTECLTLAEDSGLCCDALEGAPGVYSARFAGEGKSDADNNQKLLRLLEKVPVNCRHAHYKSVIAIAGPDKLVGTAAGEVHGVIHSHLQGTGGFGYDPLFFYPPFQKTFGEVTAEMKHKVSHRAEAFKKAKKLLENYLKEEGMRR